MLSDVVQTNATKQSLKVIRCFTLLQKLTVQCKSTGNKP